MSMLLLIKDDKQNENYDFFEEIGEWNESNVDHEP
jgi:hypothetical protein